MFCSRGVLLNVATKKAISVMSKGGERVHIKTLMAVERLLS
jgi:hypothetical protein